MKSSCFVVDTALLRNVRNKKKRSKAVTTDDSTRDTLPSLTCVCVYTKPKLPFRPSLFELSPRGPPEKQIPCARLHHLRRDFPRDKGMTTWRSRRAGGRAAGGRRLGGRGPGSVGVGARVEGRVRARVGVVVRIRGFFGSSKCRRNHNRAECLQGGRTQSKISS